MSTLSSSSTTAQIEAAYDDNASYEEDGSATKAAAFITACRLLIRRLIADGNTQTSGIRFDRVRLQAEIDHAIEWRRASRGGGYTKANLESVRS